jgi:PadR family transcriptional regulator PadR
MSPRHVSGRLATGMPEAHRLQLLPGTLEMLILQTLIFGPRHGHGIATTIQRTSDQALLVDHGSLYPALQRLERAGLMDSEWGVSENNRRARFYKLTRAGRKKLTAETTRWGKLVRAVTGVLTTPQEEES